MLLAIDIGNTHTVVGVYDGAKLVADWRLETPTSMTSDEIGLQLTSSLRDHSLQREDIHSVGVSSVVPPLTQTYVRMVSAVFELDSVVIDGATDLGIAIRYDDPMAVGADRLCNAVAGFAKYGGPLIIVDFGTATTFDVVATNGDYMGGVIAPGVETSAADLHQRAARLPKVELRLPKTLIGQDTVGSMQSGILFGAIDSTEGMVRRLKEAIRKQEGKVPVVIGTGGFSAFISEHSSCLDHREPHLVLEGVRLICERTTEKR